MKIIIFLLAICLFIPFANGIIYFENMSNNPTDYAFYDDGGDTQTIDGNTSEPVNMSQWKFDGYTGEITTIRSRYDTRCGYDSNWGIGSPNVVDSFQVHTLGNNITDGCVFFAIKMSGNANRYTGYGINQIIDNNLDFGIHTKNDTINWHKVLSVAITDIS